MHSKITTYLLFSLAAIGCRPDAQPTAPSSTFHGQDPSFGITQNGAGWHLDRVDQVNLPLNNAYTYNRSGNNVYIYILDEGVNPNDNDLSGRVLVGHNSAGGSLTSDCNPQFPHGTMVARVAAGTTYGVAKNASIIPVRIATDLCESSIAYMIAGLNWVAQDVGHRPAVVNISSGFDVKTTSIADTVAPLEDLIATLSTQLGIVVSAGNSQIGYDACGQTPQGSNPPVSPARVVAAITVGSSTGSDTRYSTSNFGSCLDLYAPGASIPCGFANPCSGTSFAAPLVAGAIALYLEGHGQSNGLSVVSRANPKLPILSGTTRNLLYMEFIPPPPPSGAAAGSVTANSATVSWTNGDNTFQTLVELRVHNVGTYTPAGTVGPTVFSKALSGLLPSSQYDVRLTHTKTNVDSAPAEFLSLFTTLTPPLSVILNENYSTGGTPPGAVKPNQTCYYSATTSGGTGTPTLNWYRWTAAIPVWKPVGSGATFSMNSGTVAFKLRIDAAAGSETASDSTSATIASTGSTCLPA